MQGSHTSTTTTTSDVETGRGRDGIMRGSHGDTMSHFETSPSSFSDDGGAAQFSNDVSGARVMREGGGSEATAFTRIRRWRKVILVSCLVLAAVVVIAFALGRRSVLESDVYLNDEEGLSSTNHGEGQPWWKLVGLPISQPNVLPGAAQDEFIEFGSMVKLDRNSDRIAVAKQGVSRAGGGIDIYSHWDTSGDEDSYVPGQWYHEANIKLPPPADGQHRHDDQAMDFAEDGKRVVFNQGNQIYVYFAEGMKGFQWVQLGNTIEMPLAHDTNTSIYGSEIAMSGDGFFVAVLGYSTVAGAPAWVDIFHYRTTLAGSDFDDRWIFVKEITLQTTKGATLAFDTLGMRLVVGEAPDEQKPARITVYNRSSQQDAASWTEGVDPMRNIDTSVPYDKFGSVVYLSNDGNRLALGTVNGEGSYFAVLQANTTSNEFGTRVDWTMLGKAHEKTPSFRRFGASVALAFDGDQLIVGAPGTPDLDISANPSHETYLHGEIFLYRYDETTDTWNEVLAPMRGVEPGDAFGHSVSISQHDHFGIVVVAGAPLRYPNQPGGSGAVTAYIIKD